MSEITITGNLASDITSGQATSGHAAASFRLARTERYRTRDGWQNGETIFITVCAWRALADQLTSSGLAKGDRVTVTGRLRVRPYVSGKLIVRDTGERATITMTEIVATAVTQPARGDDGDHQAEPADPATWNAAAQRLARDRGQIPAA